MSNGGAGPSAIVPVAVAAIVLCGALPLIVGVAATVLGFAFGGWIVGIVGLLFVAALTLVWRRRRGCAVTYRSDDHQRSASMGG